MLPTLSPPLPYHFQSLVFLRPAAEPNGSIRIWNVKFIKAPLSQALEFK